MILTLLWLLLKGNLISRNNVGQLLEIMKTVETPEDVLRVLVEEVRKAEQ